MPIYEYRCGMCHHVVSELQGMNDPPLKLCPRCNGCLEKMLPDGVCGIFRGDFASNKADKPLGKASSLEDRMNQVEQRNKEL